MSSRLKILIFGGTRGVGRFLVQQAHEAGHQVTLFARDPAATEPWRPRGVRLVAGDAKDERSVRAAVPDHDAVVVSLGPIGHERVQQFIGRATAWIVDTMKAMDMSRLILVSGLGVGGSRKDAPALMRWLLIPTVLRPTFSDRAKAEAAVLGSGLEWTIVRPLYLTDGPPTGGWHATTKGARVRRGISRADVAKFLLQELQVREFVRQAVAVEEA